MRGVKLSLGDLVVVVNGEERGFKGRVDSIFKDKKGQLRVGISERKVPIRFKRGRRGLVKYKHSYSCHISNVLPVDVSGRVGRYVAADKGCESLFKVSGGGLVDRIRPSHSKWVKTIRKGYRESVKSLSSHE